MLKKNIFFVIFIVFNLNKQFALTKPLKTYEDVTSNSDLNYLYYTSNQTTSGNDDDNEDRLSEYFKMTLNDQNRKANKYDESEMNSKNEFKFQLFNRAANRKNENNNFMRKNNSNSSFDVINEHENLYSNTIKELNESKPDYLFLKNILRYILIGK